MRADTDLERICTNRDAALAAAREAYAHAQTLLLMDKRVVIKCGEDQDPVTAKQRKFFHGPVLGQISEQVRIEGRRYVQAIWKEHLRNLFLPPKWEMQRKPFVRDRKTGEWRASKRAVPVLVEQSTEDLGIRGYSELIDKTLAYAATEWGVEFHFDIDEREAVRYQPPRRKAQQPEEATA